MRIGTALNHRDRASQSLRSLFRTAPMYYSSHDNLMNQYRVISDSIAHCPVWVKSFVEGQYRLLSDLHYDHLEFCYIQDTGDNTPPILFSTAKDTLKRSTEEFYKAGKGCDLGKLQSNFFYRGIGDSYNKPY